MGKLKIASLYSNFKKLIPAKIRLKFKPIYLKFFLRNFNKKTIVYIKKYQFHIALNPINRAVDEYIFIHRDWEPDIAKFIQSQLKMGDTFIDIGANIGYFSMLGASIVGTSGHVISFEPIGRLADQIKCSSRTNGLNNIKIKKLALGNNPCKMTLEIMPGNIGGSSLVKNINSGLSEEIFVSTLDLQLKDIKRVDLIKIDVEGFEYEVLKGGQDTISKHLPVIILEFSPSVYGRQKEDNSKNILKFLMARNYKILDIDYGYKCDNIDEYILKLGKRQTNLLASQSSWK